MIEGDGIALYARVSSDGQARDNTIASQVAALREGVAADGFLLVPDHAYVDEGYSGTILLRPALERLRDAVAGGIVTQNLYPRPGPARPALCASSPSHRGVSPGGGGGHFSEPFDRRHGGR